MVRLDRIYTKAGDDGTTALGDGVRVAKASVRVEAFGAVDELNALLGLLALAVRGGTKGLVASIQNDLFDLGADLCVPPRDTAHARRALRVTSDQVVRLERAIDTLNAKLKPLGSFILPGGTVAASWCHLARTVCRRAERRVASLMEREKVNAEVLRYLNRLSDFLFVLGRALNGNGRRDALWVPGRNAGPR